MSRTGEDPPPESCQEVLGEGQLGFPSAPGVPQFQPDSDPRGRELLGGTHTTHTSRPPLPKKPGSGCVLT